MTTIIILSILFVVMITLPLVVSFIYYSTSKGNVMKINQNVVRDQRYFSHSFAGMIENSPVNTVDHTIMLSRVEKYADPETIRKRKAPNVETLVIVRDDLFESPENVKQYEKEIYAEGDMVFSTQGVSVRAVCSKKHMILGNGTTVLRWADAEETLAVYDDCNLGISTTAGRILTIGQNASFRRLYAPVIYFGQYPDSMIDPMEGRDELVFMLPVVDEKKKIKHVTHENMTEAGTAPYSIVTSTKTVIVENAVLQGNIHTVGNVRICANSGVLGSIFSEGNILLETGSFVVGNVFAQGKIEIEDNVMVGRKGTMVSVVSRRELTIGRNVVVFGYVSSEEGGKVCPLYTEDKPRYEGDYRFAEYVAEPLDVRFATLYDYEVVDEEAFRKNEHVRSAVIPFGALKLGRSMFCNCENMQSIELPGTLEVIEDYALYSCDNLRMMTSLDQTSLTRIGTSGMEDCRFIRELRFPASITEIGAAACAGMTALESVSFAEGAKLTTLGDHAFRDCIGLTQLMLPDSLAQVGVSAFRGCSRLSYLSVPATVAGEPGIAELASILPGVRVEFRECTPIHEQ